MRRLTALGGFDAKGPACFLLEMGGARLVLDLGRGPDGGARPRLDGVGVVDAVLISHGHADHVGSLDWLGHLGDPPVYATAPVRALAGDAALAHARDLTAHNEIAGLAVQTGPAGHAPGAVWIRIGGADGLIYSGDYCAEGGVWAASPLALAAVAVLDCSYGDDAGALPEQRKALLDVISGGPALLPVPPAGRGVEMALDLQAAGLRVAICDGLHQVATHMIAHETWLQDGLAGRLDDLLSSAGRLTGDSPLDGVMLAAGANCGSGVSQVLGPRALQAGVPVIPTGHLSVGSPAADWAARGLVRRMRWNVHPNRPALADMLVQTGSTKAMAAFGDTTRRHALTARFPGIDWADREQLTW